MPTLVRSLRKAVGPLRLLLAWNYDLAPCWKLDSNKLNNKINCYFIPLIYIFLNDKYGIYFASSKIRDLLKEHIRKCVNCMKKKFIDII